MVKPMRTIASNSPGSGDNLYQVNGVAYVEGDLKLIHLRILIIIIAQLQKEIRTKISGKGSHDMPDRKKLTIDVTSFRLTPRNGGRLRLYLDELRSTQVTFPHTPSFTGLIENYSFPPYSKTVDILLQKGMVSRLLLTEEGYSNYSKKTAMELESKYTVRLYWLICSWRSKGGFIISVKDLRRILSLGPAYSREDNITTAILRPAAIRLRARYPIWFLFRFYGSGEERRIVFKIQTKVSEEQKKADFRSAWDVCFHLMHSVGANLATIEDVFAQVDYEDLKPFLSKLMSLTAHIRDHRIKNANAYIRVAMQDWLDDWSQHYTSLD